MCILGPVIEYNAIIVNLSNSLSHYNDKYSTRGLSATCRRIFVIIARFAVSETYNNETV